MKMIDLVAKALFPRRPGWWRRKQVKTILWAVLSSVIFGFVMVGIMLYALRQR
jgi:sterol desaturase/sphingolipid hydroxylase (fatty acid hydroxylase superfamily)